MWMPSCPPPPRSGRHRHWHLTQCANHSYTACLCGSVYSLSSLPPNPLPSPYLPTVSKRVFSQLVYFSRYEDEEVQLKAVTGLGFFCVRHPEMMLEQATRDLYSSWLARHASSKKKCQVLRNLQHHLKEVETTLKVADVRGKSRARGFGL